MIMRDLELKVAGGNILPSLIAKPYCDLLTEDHFVKQALFSAAWINLSTSVLQRGFLAGKIQVVCLKTNGVLTNYLVF